MNNGKNGQLKQLLAVFLHIREDFEVVGFSADLDRCVTIVQQEVLLLS